MGGSGRLSKQVPSWHLVVIDGIVVTAFAGAEWLSLYRY